MPRVTALLALVTVGLIAVAVALGLKVRSLQRDLADQKEQARVLAETKEMPGLVPKQVFDEERARTAELNRKVLELDAALLKAREEAKRVAKKEGEEDAGGTDGGKPKEPDDPDTAKLRELMKKLGKVCKL